MFKVNHQAGLVLGHQDQPDNKPSEGSWTVDRLKIGDQAAWRSAYKELWPIAFYAICRRVFSRASAEDLAQEVLTAIATQVNSFTDNRHIKVMTSIIAQRKAAHFLRDETAGKRDRRVETILDDAAAVAAALPVANWTLDLQTALDGLDPVDRALLEGHFILGLKSHELAVEHGLNASTVRGRIKRSMDSLKEKFGKTASALLVLLVMFGVHGMPLAAFAPGGANTLR